jgi:pimeloyl-ACP methyl ester carboxylesterase
MSATFQFHTGYYDNLHPEASINFQMNRWINYLGEETLEDMQALAARLTGLASYREEFLALADSALAQGRRLPAAYYYRSAEFFMGENDPRKAPTRQKFLELLLKELRIPDKVYHQVPYPEGGGKAYLPAYSFSADHPRGTLVVHGGFDSYIEEFFPILLHLRDQGYSVVCFEGPGQGGALRDSRLLLTHEWHKPVKAVLDFFKLEDVTLMGISMGGCLALRAAACEPRIIRVVAYDVFLNWMDTTLSKLRPIAPLMRLLMKTHAEKMFNALLDRIMEKSALFEWAMQQAMLVMGVSTSFEVFRLSRFYTTRDISSLVNQDVMLMAGSEDHVIPLDHFHEQARILINARSVTARLFTREEQAQNHCQIGNLSLAVESITGWIDKASKGLLPQG